MLNHEEIVVRYLNADCFQPPHLSSPAYSYAGNVRIHTFINHTWALVSDGFTPESAPVSILI